MKNSQKLFRYVWRIDAVLILVATGVITLGAGVLLLQEVGSRVAMRHEARVGVSVDAPETNESDVHLLLGHASLVPGSTVMRADLSVNGEGKGFGSSSGYSETRNVLFIDPTQKTAHWLLPDNDHIVAENSDITDERDPSRRTVATAVLVKPGADKQVSGKLLLFDSTGTKIVEVADDVRDIQVASLVGGDLTLLYERNRRLVFAAFDPASLVKKKEQEIQVPQLK